MNDAMHYLAFGDSITSGNNVHKDERYPAILAKHVEQYAHRPIMVHNLGKSGMSSSKLLQLLQVPEVFNAINRSQLVTVCIGGDDLIYGYIKWRIFRKSSYLQKSMKKLRRNTYKLCHILRAAAPPQCILSTFYNPFPHTPLAVDTVRYCNEHILYPIAQQYGYPVADLYDAFKGREHVLLDHYRSGLLEDYRPFTPNSPIHPNVQGYRVIASRFFDKI